MKLKKLVSVGMLLMLTTSMLPEEMVRAEETEDTKEESQLLVHYDMTEEDGKLIDVTGNGYDATYVGLTEENFIVDGDDAQLNFTGDQGDYVKLPDGIIPGENFTIETTFTTTVEANHWLYCFGTIEDVWPNVKNYIFCNPNQSGGTIRVGVKDDTTEQLCQSASIEEGEENTLVVTFSEDGVMTVYLNGEFVQAVEHGYSIMDILENGVSAATDCIGYIGRSLYTVDPAFIGTISDFKVYNYTKTEEEIMSENEKTEEEIVALTKENLTIPNASNIRGNITLPTTSDEGAAITWKSNREDVISTTEVEDADYDATPAGVVSRQTEDTDVILTATITCGEVTDTSKIQVTVKAKGEELTSDDYGGYLFVHFTGESTEGEQIYFALSQDGLNWTDLNDGDPVLISDVGEEGVRDPFIVRSPEGDKFYLIATDLRIASGKGWSVAQYSGSRALIIWESDDLVNWSEPRRVVVGIPEAGCVWAPEAVYDSKTGEYMVFWASMVQEEGDTEAKQRIYYSKTRDFYTFTEAQKYIERDNHVIDTTILSYDGNYYRYSKDETTKRIGIDTSDQLLHSTFTTIESDTLDSLSGVEGPLIFKFNDRNEWCLMVDQYSSGDGYLPLVTDDLSSGEFEILSEDEYSLGTNLKRHGTVLNLTNEEYSEIYQKWMYETETVDEQEQEDPILSYTFETETSQEEMTDGSGNNYNGTLYGNASYVNDSELDSTVLYLDGTDETYAAFPQGFFDGRDTVTISMDLKAELVTGDFFTFTIGKNNSKYMFLRTRDTSIRNAITTGSYSTEQAASFSTDSIQGQWMNLKLVITPTSMQIYRDGELMCENDEITISMSDLGSNLLAYLGKSFYSADQYFQGYFDNVKVYNRALTATEIAKEFGKTADTITDVQAEGYHIIKNDIDQQANTIRMYISRNNSGLTELTTVPLQFTLSNGASLVEENGTEYNLAETNQIQVQCADGTVQEWTIEATMCNNNILSGLYADPDIDVFGDTYYIYPTTDGFTGWSGTEFHVFSSNDLVDWVDQGVILDVATDDVPWAVGSAWAPTIEEKDGVYYFYFCAKREDGDSCIGVAVSDSPLGPFVAQDTPLLTPEIVENEGVSVGQTIDPSIFTDEDGSSYLYFGNGSAAVVELNEDMVSLKSGTMKNLSGLTDFRESVVVIKRNGVYHFTWSCDDTGSEDYHVNYGVSDSPYGEVTYLYTLLSKNTSEDILGTGHQSILKIPGTDEYYIAYHRFGTPLSDYTSGKGYYRETCLDRLTFDEEGYLQVVVPTLTGITEQVIVPTSTEEVEPTPTEEAEPTPTEEAEPTPTEEAEPTPTEEAEPTPTEEAEPTPTEEAEPTPTEEAEPTPTKEAEPTPTEEAEPTPTEEAEPTPTEEAEPTPTEEVEPTPTEEAEPTPTEEAEPTPTEEAEPTPTEEAEPTPTEEAEPTPTEEAEDTSSSEITVTPGAIVSTIEASGNNLGAEISTQVYDWTLQSVVRILGDTLEESKLEEVYLPVISEEQMILLRRYGYELEVQMIIPEELTREDSEVDYHIILPKEVLEVAKDKGAGIKVDVRKANYQELYCWSFGAENLAECEGAFTDLDLVVDTVSLEGENRGVKVSILEKDNLADARLKVYVGDSIDSSERNQKLYSYRYNESSGQLETIPYSCNYQVDQDGTITFPVIAGKDYIFRTQKAESSEVTSLLEQVRLFTDDLSFDLANDSVSSAQIEVELPETLQLVEELTNSMCLSDGAIGKVKLSFHSNNEKVAVVDESGLIVAVGSGTAMISVEIELYSGKSRTVQFGVTVKE